MEQADLLRRLLGILEAMEVPYMVVGSLASAAYGEPRMTQDVDIVVDPTEEQVRRLCRFFPSSEFYVSEESALDAMRRKTQFNIIDSLSANKIDVMIVPDSNWGRSELSRRRRMRILPDLDGYCARPEDVILGKMSYYAEGGSEKHLRDITGILKVSAADVDLDYVSRWAQTLGLNEVWDSVRRRLGIGQSSQ